MVQTGNYRPVVSGSRALARLRVLDLADRLRHTDFVLAHLGPRRLRRGLEHLAEAAQASTRTAVREVDRLLANVPLLCVDLGRRRDVRNVFGLLKGLSLRQQGPWSDVRATGPSQPGDRRRS